MFKITQDIIALVILVPLISMFLISMIIKPKAVLGIQQKLYMKLLGIDMRFSKKTERIIQVVAFLVLIITLVGVYLQLWV